MALTRRVAAFGQEVDDLDLAREYVEQYEIDRAKILATQQDFLAWALRVPEPKGSLDFARFPFQPEIYRELGWCREGVIMKGTQVGVSAFLARWTLFGADTRGVTALYVFPTKQHVYDFSDARIKPLIRNSEYLRGRVPYGYVQNKGLKQVGIGFVYYRGSESKNDLDSVDADWLALDEYDTLVQANIPDAERRIGGSLSGMIRRVGVPSIPNYGIAKRYDESDAREWMVKCEACGEWQEIDFYPNVEWIEEYKGENVRRRADEEAAADHPTDGIVMETFRVCRECRKPIDVAQGEWVARHPHRPTPGFHVTRLLVPRANLKEIVEASKHPEPYRVSVFHNKDRGEPYASDENRLSLAALQAAQRDFAMVEGIAYTEHYITMGVDVASKRALNVRISEHLDDRTKKALWIGTVSSFNDLPKLMERYRVNMAAIDHLPEYRLSRSFAAKFPGRVYLVNYTGQAQHKVIDIKTETWEVSVRRVEAIDATLEQIRTQRNLLPINWPEGYTAHMQALYRKVEVDPEDGEVDVEYISTGPADYCHAEVYDLVANEVWWAVSQINDLRADTFTPLDEMLEFERSHVHEAADYDYRPGFEDEEEIYSPGFLD